MRLVSFLYKLLFNVKNSSISHNQEELFHSDIFLRPNKTNYKTCPKCKKTAKTNKLVLEDCEFFINPTNCPILQTNLTNTVELKNTVYIGQSVQYGTKDAIIIRYTYWLNNFFLYIR